MRIGGSRTGWQGVGKDNRVLEDVKTKTEVWDVWRFYKSLSPFHPQGIPLHLAPSPVLLLSDVEFDDEGSYSCVATYPSHGPQESPAVRVVIGEKNLSPNPRDPGAGLRDSADTSSLAQPGTVSKNHTTPPWFTHIQASSAPPKLS